jgi:hypothetical protein
MYTQPIILPLDANGSIYAIQDERGHIIGTGTREVCEVLLFIVNKTRRIIPPSPAMVAPRPNVRAAIAI